MTDIISLLHMDVMDHPLWLWLVFAGAVFVLILLDLGVLHRKPHEIKIGESLRLSAFYIAAGLLFGLWIWHDLGEVKASEYFTGFVVEKTLSMDNIFVMAMIFQFFSIPRTYQHIVLVYGIIGVLILRGIMIGLGATLIAQFHWILYIFAAFLIFTGIKMLFMDHDSLVDIKSNPLLRFLKKHARTTDSLHGKKFIVRKNAKLYMTPLLVCLIMIECADVIFAVDSIPAIFGITTDPYIVFTSNVFAILGLRALYFALAAMIARFAYLKYALSVVLIFIGGKMLAVDFAHVDISPELSLTITIAILGAGFFYSLWKTRKEA